MCLIDKPFDVSDIKDYFNIIDNIKRIPQTQKSLSYQNGILTHFTQKLGLTNCGMLWQNNTLESIYFDAYFSFQRLDNSKMKREEQTHIIKILANKLGLYDMGTYLND